MNDNDQDLYLEPTRRLSWQAWAAMGLLAILLLGAGGLAAVLGARHSGVLTATAPGVTLVPTFTPRLTATPTPAPVTLTVRPWGDDSGPVGLLEVTLSLPGAARVSHEPPPGYRYWGGDLLPTRANLAWNGAGASQVRWYLLRGPEAVLPATLTVTVDGQALTATLERGAPVTGTLLLE